MLSWSTYQVVVENNNQKTVHEPSTTHLHGICGAMAALRYDQERYLCPEKIYEQLEKIDGYPKDGIIQEDSDHGFRVSGLSIHSD